MKKLDPAYLRQQIVGVDSTFQTPFGERLMVYCDYTASGRCLRFVESYLQSLQRVYANTHTEDDITGRSMSQLLHEAEESIKNSVNAGPEGRIIACGTGATLAGIASALRAGGADFTLRMEDSDTSSFLWRYDDTGQELFHWRAPDGFPDVRASWQRMTPRVMSWRLCNWLIDFDDADGRYYLDIVGQTPAGVRTANELADLWIDRILGRPMSPGDRQEMVEFMAQGHNPDFDLPLDTDEDTQDHRDQYLPVQRQLAHNPPVTASTPYWCFSYRGPYLTKAGPVRPEHPR
mgnify:CR=1 FL=1